MLYSLDKIIELAGGEEDQEFILSIVGVFLEEIPNDLSSLKEAIANQDFEGIYQFAHKIKPNVDLLGMEETRKNVLEIETQGKGDKDMGVINSLFPSVEDTINKVVVQLKENFGL